MPEKTLPENVVVIGAGLGGLCLAQGLRKAGIPCTVYERDPSPDSRRQGYRLHIDSRGDDALQATLPPHLHELFRATSGRARPTTPVYDTQLNLISETELDSGSVQLNINRFTLRQILLEGLEDVHFGKEFVRYERDNGATIAHFADGTSARCAVLVGADGVNSPVRRQYLPYARVVDAGVRHLYGKIPLTAETRELFDPAMYAVFTIVAGPDKSFIGFAPVDYPEPVADASARLAPGLRLRDHEPYMTCSYSARKESFPQSDEELWELSGEAMQSLVRGRVKTWHPRVREMVENWMPEAVFPLAIRTSVPIGPWEPTTITLVGDAIHAMSPAAASGANTALRDGAELAAALSSGGSDAIGGYETRMREYGFGAVRESATRGHRTMGQDPLPDDAS